MYTIVLYSHRYDTIMLFPTLFSLCVVVLYAVFAAYFAGVMVRLMLTLTPIVCVLSAIVFSKTFDNHLYEGELPEDVPPVQTAAETPTTSQDRPSSAKKGKRKKKEEKVVGHMLVT